MVKLEVFWYKFQYKDNEGKLIEKNNKQEAIDAVINMIHEMEKRQSRTILHRMLIEQRIKFTELKYNVV